MKWVLEAFESYVCATLSDSGTQERIWCPMALQLCFLVASSEGCWMLNGRAKAFVALLATGDLKLS